MSFQRDLPIMVKMHSIRRSCRLDADVGFICLQITADSINDAATFIHLTREALSEDWWLAAALEYSNLRYQTRSARVYCMELLERGQTSGADFIRYTARFDSLKNDFERWRHKWITEGNSEPHQTSCPNGSLSLNQFVSDMFKDAAKSRLMLSFYSTFMAFFISRTRTDVFSAFHDRNRDMAYQTSNHANSLIECYSDATAVLSSLQHIATQKYALIYLPVSSRSDGLVQHPRF